MGFFIAGKHLHGDSLFLEYVFEVLHRTCFIAGWVAGVELHESPEMSKRFRLVRLPVKCRLAATGDRGIRDEDNDDEKRRLYRRFASLHEIRDCTRRRAAPRGSD
jgi:hypothetical protein